MASRILLINGPNLNMLGIREPSTYGYSSIEDINLELGQIAKEKGVLLEFFQSNHEGAIVDRIHEAYNQTDLIIINAGALSHYSIAVYDALKAVNIPLIEVHLTNIYAREDFRQHSLISPIAAGGIFGLCALSYKMAFLAACELLERGEN